MFQFLAATVTAILFGFPAILSEPQAPSGTAEAVPPAALARASTGKLLDVQIGAQPATTTTIPAVPYFSQFKDISSPAWQKVGCGITDLAMIIDYYSPGAATVNGLLAQGIKAHAYDYNAGWIYQGLIELSKRYGLDGRWYDLSKLDNQAALVRFKQYLADGPVILSVHYKFDSASTIPHLVVIDAIRNDIVYYDDPAAAAGPKQIPLADFLKAWKKKVIVIRPA